MTSWGDLINGLKVSGNVAKGNAAGTNLSYYGGITVTGNTEVYCTVPVKPLANVALFRIDGSLNGYAIYMSAGTPDTWVIYRMDALTPTSLNFGTFTFTAGDKFYYQRTGNVHCYWHFNGTTWVLLGTAIDSTYNGAADVLAALLDDNTTGQIDDFGGGISKPRYFLIPN